jgi:biotin transport system substrate-specific component
MTTRILAEPKSFPSLLRRNGRVRAARLGAILIGTALLAVSAHIEVPFWPVPMSMQTLVVLLIGFTGGARIGGATMLAYLAEGALGLPVFHGGGGIAYLAGPTAGYLFGFVPAAIVVGALAERGAAGGIARIAAALLLGDALIFACGLAWLTPSFGLTKSATLGLLPFLPAEAAKLALALAVASLLRRRRG